MKKFRAAVWQYYKRFLSLFAVCAVVSLIFQGLWLEPIGEVFPVGIPFFSPFFFLFVLCTGNTFALFFPLYPVCLSALPRPTSGKIRCLRFWKA